MEKNNYKIATYTKKDSKNNTIKDKYEKEENLFEDKEKKLIGSVYDEITFRENIDKILSKFLRTIPEYMNGNEESNRELYRKYYLEITDRYYEKVSNKFKAKFFDSSDVNINHDDIPQFRIDIGEILFAIDSRYIQDIIYIGKPAPNRIYADAMFDYCINQKEKLGVKFKASAEDIEAKFHPLSFNKSSFLRELSTYYNKPKKTK